MGVSFSTCAPPRPEIIKQIRRGQKLEKKWNESSDWKNIRDRYGKLEVQSNAHPIAGENINRSTEAKSFGYRMLDEIAMQTIAIATKIMTYSVIPWPALFLLNLFKNCFIGAPKVIIIP